MKPESLAKLKKLEKEARDRIASRGKLEFRADPDMIKEILDLARERRQIVGPMIRQWVKERLELEIRGTAPLPEQLKEIDEKLDRLCEAFAQFARDN